MADIFVSYARADRDRVEPLVRALLERGWSVFWDSHILPGQQWDALIESELEAARCILVVWSPNSVDRVMVRTEASFGRDRRILVPVMLERCETPLMFRLIQTEDLSGAAFSERDGAFKRVLESLERFAGAPKPAAAELRRRSAAPRPAPSEKRTVAPAAEPTAAPKEKAAGANGDASTTSGGGDKNETAFDNIFKEVFGAPFGDLMTSPMRRGENMQTEITISLEEAARGKEVELRLSRRTVCAVCGGVGAEDPKQVSTCQACRGSGKTSYQSGFFKLRRTCEVCGGAGVIIERPCPACNGDGKGPAISRTLMVKTPKGVRDGAKLRLAGEGEIGVRGGRAGDLFVLVAIAPHDRFQRNDDDLTIVKTVSAAAAKKGGPVDVDLLDGGVARFQLPAGSKSGQRLRLRGYGMPKLKSDERGDLYVELAVEGAS